MEYFDSPHSSLALLTMTSAASFSVCPSPLSPPISSMPAVAVATSGVSTGADGSSMFGENSSEVLAGPGPVGRYWASTSLSTWGPLSAAAFVCPVMAVDIYSLCETS